MKKVNKEGKIENVTKEEIMEKFKDFPLYSQDKPMEQVQVVSRFFIPNSQMVWLITEASEEEDGTIMMFGWCRITDGELGYVTLNEMMEIGLILLDEKTPLETLDVMIKKEGGVVY